MNSLHVLVTNKAMGVNGVQVPREILKVMGCNADGVFYDKEIDIDTAGSKEGAAKTLKLGKQGVVNFRIPAPDTRLRKVN